MNNHPATLVTGLFVMAMLACSLSASPATQPDLVATVAAQAVALEATAAAAHQTSTPDSAAAANGVTGSVAADTNCTSGPGGKTAQRIRESSPSWN